MSYTLENVAKAIADEVKSCAGIALHPDTARDAARAALAASPGPAVWEPIETAPKVVGKDLLACSYEVLELQDGRKHVSYHCAVVQWTDWRPEGGWYNGDMTVDEDYFTHWRPLPAGPEQGAPKTQGE